MFSTHIKLAFRNLARYKTYSILNILGLAVGLALGIFVIIDISYSFGYDRFHPAWDRMYKLLAFIEQGEGKSFTNFSHPLLTGDALKQEAPEIESYNRQIYTSLYFNKENSPIQENGIYSDGNIFTMFNFGLKQGDPSTVLNEPANIAISERLAKKLFGDKQAFGQIVSVLVNNKPETFKVAGIFKNIEHSLLGFEFVLPVSSYLKGNPMADNISASNCEYVFTLKPNSDVNAVNNKIRNFFEGKDNTVNKQLFMQPLWEVRLYYYMNGQKHMNHLLIVLITTIIGGLILLISVFNFVNMAIAMGIKRNREVGIKKVLGSNRRTIILQFLTESVVICLIALFFAFIIIETFLPFFNQSAYVNLKIEYTRIGKMLLYIGFAILTGVLAALYPAIRLASASPVKVLKGMTGNRQRIGFSRQGLIVFQFSVTLLLVIGLFVFNRQAKFVETKDIGLNREDIVYFTVSEALLKHRSAFHAELQTIPEISSIMWSSQLPIRIYQSTTNVLWPGKQANEKMDFWMLDTDLAFENTFHPQLAGGRFFSPSLASDSANFIVNQEAVRNMHLNNPVGEIITVDGQKGEIIGVVKNFHSLQIQAPYVPVIIRNRTDKANMVFLKFMGDKDKLTAQVSKIYKQYESYIPLDFSTVEGAFNDLNRFSRNSFMVIAVFSVMALFLACMGLYGLASFTIETRTKEIGIRKSNGATTLSILKMFLKTYNKWILIASCIALPIGYFVWNTLLGTLFNFRCPFPLWSIFAAPLLVMIIAWSTIVWQSYKAASKNPVDALRYE